jgi:hypothetical protein
MTRLRSLRFAGLFAALALAAVTFQSTPAKADLHCNVTLNIVKGAFIFGVGGGNGTLRCGKRAYRLQVGGVGAGLLIGISRATLSGPVRRLRRVQDIEGTYAGAGAGVAVAGGVRSVSVRNQNGVELNLSGTQVGLSGGVGLNGLTLRFSR